RLHAQAAALLHLNANLRLAGAIQRAWRGTSAWSVSASISGERFAALDFSVRPLSSSSRRASGSGSCSSSILLPPSIPFLPSNPLAPLLILCPLFLNRSSSFLPYAARYLPALRPVAPTDVHCPASPLYLLLLRVALPIDSNSISYQLICFWLPPEARAIDPRF
ncbi:hypothetical protein B0H13DRAFT_2655834, partial [Mycena leptocephala]